MKGCFIGPAFDLALTELADRPAFLWNKVIGSTDCRLAGADVMRSLTKQRRCVRRRCRWSAITHCVRL